MSGRPVATPARAAASSAALARKNVQCTEVFKGGLDLTGAEQVLSRLPDNLKREASVDLCRRLGPVILSWQTQWDQDDGELEPEEALSSEGEEAVEAGPKRRRRGHGAVEYPAAPDDGYPSSAWPQGAEQGTAGFNDIARQVFEANGDWSPSSKGDAQLLLQQKFVAFMMHPKSPVERLLVDHNTGSGKTLVMVRTADNYFYDGRPLIMVFPKDSVVDNFYLSILEWPSRWRDYICFRDQALARTAANRDDWHNARHERWQLDLRNSRIEQAMEAKGTSLQATLKELFIRPARTILEMKRCFFNGRMKAGVLEDFQELDTVGGNLPPAAPLRAYRFTSAGGSAAEMDEHGQPRGCVFKIGYDEGAPYNPYSNKVVIMDESHHLTRPHFMYARQLNNLRKYLSSATNTVLLACTGSMIEDSVADPKTLLNAVMGNSHQGDCYEGFLSSHHRRGPAFPRQVPVDCADGHFNPDPRVQNLLVSSTELTDASLVRYVNKVIELQRNRETGDDHQSPLANWANVYVYFGSVNGDVPKRNISLHTDTHAPKFYAVVQEVLKCHAAKEKCVVLCSRRTGYKALHALLLEAGKKHKFGVAELSERADFNAKKNNRGQDYMCLVADADAGSESIEFKCVRHVIQTDVPCSHSSYIQRSGRAVRTNSHLDLPDEDKTVRFKFVQAVLPEFARTEVGAFALYSLCGFFGGPKKVQYNTEPEPSDIIDGAIELVDAFEAAGLNSVIELRDGQDAAQDALKGVDLESKLQKRIKAALKALTNNAYGGVQAALAFQRDTIDERRLRNLSEQAARLAPAAARVRNHAIDTGLY